MTAIAAGQVGIPRATVEPIPLIRITAVELRRCSTPAPGSG
jgi:hypothetical protein